MATATQNDQVNDIQLKVLKETISAIQADPELGKCDLPPLIDPW